MEREEKKLFFRKNRTIEQRQAGKFQNHFYKGMQALLDDGSSSSDQPEKKLRIVSQRLNLVKGEDLMELLAFEETSCDEQFKITANYKNCAKVGLKIEAVDAMIISAMASAKAE